MILHGLTPGRIVTSTSRDGYVKGQAVTLLDSYRYQGRHRQDPPGSAVSRVAVVAALTAGGLAAGAAPALAVDWDPIIACESGGRNIKTQIPGPYTASGVLQITNGTWRLNGGTQFAPTAMQATRAQQIIVGERIVARRIAAGDAPLADWTASRSCWAGKVGSTRPAAKAAAPKAAPKSAPRPAAKPAPRAVVAKPAKPRPAVSTPRPAARPAASAPRPAVSGMPAGYRVKSGDTLSQLAVTYGIPGGYLALARTNRIDDPDMIRIGKRLR